MYRIEALPACRSADHYEVRGSNRSRRIRRAIELSELAIRVNSITGFGVAIIISVFLHELWPCPYLCLTGVTMSHPEMFDAAIHDGIGLAAIGRGTRFPRIALHGRF